MKLLNQSLKYLSVSILIIVSLWSVIFYFSMLDEIYDSIDDGLDNYKLLIIQKADRDSTILKKIDFDENNYAIRQIPRQSAVKIRDTYRDTLLYMQYENDLEPVRMLTTAFEHRGSFYQLKVISSMVEEDDLTKNLFWSILWLYLILLGCIVLVNNFALQKLWNPFYSLLHHLKSFRLENNEQFPEITTDTKEFKELINAVKTLIKHTLEAYSHQKQFTENAAHELQTPLAIATNKLELLLEKGELDDAQADNIAQVLQIIERLTRLNKSLLLLTKIENRQFFNNQKLSVNQIVRQCISDLEDSAHFKNVKITLDEPVAAEIEMDATLANILISNLIKNAIFHNTPNGEVSIFIAKTTLKIRNTGEPKGLNEEQLFNRFHKGTSGQAGTGIGLAIVKAVCKLYDFKIAYRFKGEHCFELRFGDK